MLAKVKENDRDNSNISQGKAKPLQSWIHRILFVSAVFYILIAS